MLKSLYKYTSFRPEFFSNLLVRGSQKFALNDPFEMTPGAKKRMAKNDPRDAYFDYAIFSLSETKNNLLMWSHYSDEHKGIVVEFDTNVPIFERKYFKDERVLEISNIGLENYEEIDANEHWLGADSEEVFVDLDATKTIRLINPGLYNSERPSFDNFDSILEHFLVKSDEWIYEKEHRIILPLIDVDKLNVCETYDKHITGDSYWFYESLSEFSKNGRLLVSFQDIIEEELTHAHRCIIDPSRSRDEKEYCDNYKRARYGHSIFKLSKDPTSIFLYKLNPKSIKSISMGARMNEESKRKLICELNKNDCLCDVTLYESYLSTSRFEVKFRVVNR
ncbi:DUF2971 domain-containing protein [Vibrio parahaemolyticus]|uniref:DUF2971 domain-containing protein n=1 Tax=Vibrio parahaemolyticus TaxID=670 RepID=UPI000C7B533B|nr:DUF2971 domain-containing protein [Vibrio parahaemolyticus]PLR58524.1 hypothetical protein CYU11_06535 [Vibrio parahaemolyticus]